MNVRTISSSVMGGSTLAASFLQHLTYVLWSSDGFLLVLSSVVLVGANSQLYSYCLTNTVDRSNQVLISSGFKLEYQSRASPSKLLGNRRTGRFSSSTGFPSLFVNIQRCVFGFSLPSYLLNVGVLKPIGNCISGKRQSSS